MVTNMRNCFSKKVKMLTRKWSAVLLGVWVALSSPVSLAQTPNSLEGISFNTLPGNRLQIALRLAAPAAEPLSFTINDPARISLDLLSTQNNLPQRSIPIGLGLARSITTAEAKGRTRVVLNLAQLVPYSTEVDNNTIYLTLENEPVAGQPMQTGKSATAIANEAVSMLPELDRGVAEIDFRRGSKGEARGS